MRVVEIGCGRQGGPFFEGAAEHFIVDPDLEVLGAAHLQDPALTPIHGSAADLEFEDASVDTVLARNVFGDPGLCMNSVQKVLRIAEIAMLDAEDRAKEVAEMLLQMEADSSLLKGDIMREAARILIPNGKLVVVEHLSPLVTRRFFENAADYCAHDTDFDLDSVFKIEEGVELADVTPPNYARAHASRKTETWVATKI